MIISLEGLWFSPKERFIHTLAKHKPEFVDLIKCCPAPHPQGEFIGWMRSVTKSSSVWRDAAEREEVVIIDNSPFSIPAYSQQLSEFNLETGEAEHNLITEIVKGLSELMPLPNVTILFMCDPLEPPGTHKALHRDTPLHVMEQIQQNLVGYAQNLKRQGVSVVGINAPKPKQSWESWYTSALQIIKATIKASQ